MCASSKETSWKPSQQKLDYELTNI
jgi:hypothetical protein